MDPFHRSLTQSNSDGGRPPHYTKTRAPAISSQSNHRNGHLSVSVAPVWSEATSQPVSKMGVASLLFHRTLSPKDALQVHSYTLEKQQQPHTQLQVHSYAREHQPRLVQHKTCSHTEVQSSSPTPSCEKMEPQPESKIILTNVVNSHLEAQNPVLQDQDENKLKILMPVRGPVEVNLPEAEPASKSSPPSTQTQVQDINKSEMDAPKNKRKVCVLIYFFTQSIQTLGPVVVFFLKHDTKIFLCH